MFKTGLWKKKKLVQPVASVAPPTIPSAKLSMSKDEFLNWVDRVYNNILRKTNEFT